MSELTRAAVLAAGGLLAGIVGTAGGITTLVSFPALLLVGVSPLPASIANTVAVVACWPGSMLTSRVELAGRSRWLLRWSPVALLGGIAGAALLLTTPPGVFAHLVPFLLVAGSAALLLQGPLARWADRRLGRSGLVVLPLGLFLVTAYNGYFGAGAGVLTLVLLLILVDHRLVHANAMKNVFVGVASVVSAATYALLGHVAWEAVAPLAAGLFCGSLLGPIVARRVPPTPLRWVVALTGLGFAVRLWLAPL